MKIPVVIISYNNHRYVNNTINQLVNINPAFLNDVVIMDNNSTDIDSINFLTTTKCKVVYNTENKGPWIEKYPDFYNSLPNKFFITDPDLEFNKKLPKDFTEILSNLSNRFGCHKIGLALDISDFDQMYNTKYYFNSTIYDWEKKFWNKKINDVNFELYDATIDTTFCLINKQPSNTSYKQMRIAGNFTAKHLPWYRKNLFYNQYEKYIYGINSFSNSSTMSKLFLNHIDKNYYITSKNDEKFLINNMILEGLQFWKKKYPNWEKNIFNVFDKYLNKNKVFIDVGARTGATSMYGSRKSKHVYAVEDNVLLIKDLSLNLSNNCINKNYTIIKKKITINAIINDYNIDLRDISLIKINIKGSEENMLNDLSELYYKHSIPLHISIYYNLWKNKNLNRFIFLTQELKEIIKNNSSIDLLFADTKIQHYHRNLTAVKNQSIFRNFIKNIIFKMCIFLNIQKNK